MDENENKLPENAAEKDPQTPEDVQPSVELKQTAEEREEESGNTPAQQQTAEHSGSSESDQSEDHEEDHADDHSDHEDVLASVDFDNATKQEILDVFTKFSHEENMKKLDRALKEIKPHYDEIFEREKSNALQHFLQEGNSEEDFDYKGDDTDRRFHELYDILRERRHAYFSQLEKDREKNLARKNEILDKIRELVDGEESMASMNAIKKLQSEWKQIGQVPGQYVKSLWANYNALMDRYYDHRSIYFELKELDRKKNLEAKMELCERAEALDKMENLKDAIFHLNELHEEFKHIGPVPKEEQDAVWDRFKAASDVIYAKRKKYFEELKQSQQVNLDKKIALGEQVAEFAHFTSDRISDWNQKTKEILDLQKKWEAYGSLPRDKAKEINKRFWQGFKKFFSNKNAFFKALEGQREENLEKKKALLAKAEEVKESQNWDQASGLLKKLQNEWREIGPVPEKFRNEIYQQFKTACDHFFERKRNQNSEQNKEFEDNLRKKQEICDMLEASYNSDTIDLGQVYDLLDSYGDIGFVPRHAIRSIHQRFDKVTNQLVSLEELSDDQRNELKIQVQVNKLKNSPHGTQKIHRKEGAIKRKISTLESDITTWRNNLEFFAASKNADQLKDDFNEKIENAEKELEELKKQLDVLNQA